MKRRLIKSLIQSKIVDISRVCDLICVQFETRDKKEISLHVQSFFRIIRGQQIILTSEDMYRCGKKCDSEVFEWDIPGNSIFDECLCSNKRWIYKERLIKIKRKKCGDLLLTFENNMFMQIFVDTTCVEEKYRIFDDSQDSVIETILPR